MEFSEEAYNARLEELYRISPSVQQAGFVPGAYKPGLDGMVALDAAVGHPASRLTAVHVAGTNGKGSVCSMLASALAASGRKTGLYTSPHLLDFRERMKIIGDGYEMISREEVWEFLERYSDAIRGRSFFEVTTAMAFWWFDRRGIDVAVIETGLGGRLDSTNILNPVLSVITSIGLDHCALLGNSRAEIAAEKAGIFKKDVPALVWGRDEETGPVFCAAAERTGCRLHYAEDITGGIPEWGLDLGASCQKTNLRTVLAALSLMDTVPHKEAICRAAARTGFRGRWEHLSAEPCVIADIGHNPDALEINFSKLKEFGRPPALVYGVMADKDYRTNIGLFPEGSEVIATAPATPRALGTAELVEAVKEIRPDLAVTASLSVADAIGKAMGYARLHPGHPVYIGGSTFVVAEALEYFEKI